MSAHPLKLVALGASILTVLLFQFFHLGRILDTGDGIAHYQVARDAIHNPELFLNTWGRPFFTLLMSIPSQFGMDAIILINILIATLTAVLLYQVAILLGINNGWLAAVLLITSQSTWNTIFAGLTEPLFLLLSVSSILLIVQNKRNFAYFLLGILILTRPEAIIIAPLTFTIDIFHNRPVFIAIIKANKRLLKNLLVAMD
jgi:Gpi18-like mannosyltransferase